MQVNYSITEIKSDDKHFGMHEWHDYLQQGKMSAVSSHKKLLNIINLQLPCRLCGCKNRCTMGNFTFFASAPVKAKDNM